MTVYTCARALLNVTYMQIQNRVGSFLAKGVEALHIVLFHKSQLNPFVGKNNKNCACTCSIHSKTTVHQLHDDTCVPGKKPENISWNFAPAYVITMI